MLKRMSERARWQTVIVVAVVCAVAFVLGATRSYGVLLWAHIAGAALAAYSAVEGWKRLKAPS
jgi:membrane protein YdbS with pleckstrin-like domain